VDWEERYATELFPKMELMECGRLIPEGEHRIDGEFIAFRSPVVASDGAAFLNNGPTWSGFGFGFGGTFGIRGGDLARGSTEKYTRCDWDAEFKKIATFWWWMSNESCVMAFCVNGWRWECRQEVDVSRG